MLVDDCLRISKSRRNVEGQNSLLSAPSMPSSRKSSISSEDPGLWPGCTYDEGGKLIMCICCMGIARYATGTPGLYRDEMACFGEGEERWSCGK